MKKEVKRSKIEHVKRSKGREVKKRGQKHILVERRKATSEKVPHPSLHPPLYRVEHLQIMIIMKMIMVGDDDDDYYDDNDYYDDYDYCDDCGEI